MKARILNGNLHLERQGQFKPCRCPFSITIPQQACGDWCPLFGEARPNIVPHSSDEQQGWLLTLCHSILLIQSFEAGDQRPIQHLPDTGFDQ